ncbi:MAG: hypothetical protein ACRDWH_01220 [Acidimicrobiia bacterium]
MSKVRWIFVALLAMVGAVWLGQGVGLIEGSFMTGEPLWAGIGAVLLLAAVTLLISGWRRT